jgi:hypothetical protein
MESDPAMEQNLLRPAGSSRPGQISDTDIVDPGMDQFSLGSNNGSMQGCLEELAPNKKEE